ncbi:MAG: hypothetical protein U0835_16080 [Isosphaeraceae bacterium]
MQKDCVRLLRFAAAHPERVFVVEDVARIHWDVLNAIAQVGGVASLAVWSVADQSHWVDLRLLARDVRLAAGRHIDRYKDLWSDELGTRYKPADRAGAPSLDVNSSKKAPTAEQIRDDYERLRALAVRLADEADAPREPSYVLNNLRAADKQGMSRDLAALIAKVTSSSDPPDSPSAEQSQTTTLGSAGTQPGGPESSHHPEECPGHGAAARAGIVIHGLTVMNSPGLCVSSARLPELIDRVRLRFEAASKLLAEDRELRPCFEWEQRGFVELNGKGHPEIDPKKLSRALEKVTKGLVDGLNRPPAIPLAVNGGPDLNPERWGFWPGCHRGLWAWREVRRAAEILRTFQSSPAIGFAHRLDPLVRTEKPDLRDYRRLNMPVLTPGPGNRFVVIRLRELKARCLAAVCRLRGYASAADGRLFQHLLRLEDPLEEMTRELFLAAGGRIGSRPTSPVVPADLEWWSRLTAALLDTLPLGLPDSLLKVYLELEYGIDLGEAELARLKGIFCKSVAYEIKAFLEDRSHFLTARNLGRTANEVIESASNPDTAGAQIRNRIKSGRPDPFGGQSGDQKPSMLIAADLFGYRGKTLSGRPTLSAAQAEVRRAEWLGSADDVVLDVAYNRLRAGYRVLALADDEILLEVTESGSSDDCVNRLVPHVRTPILQGLDLRFEVEVADVW